MKLIVKETLEQGMPRANGGMLKLRAGEHLVAETADGLRVDVDGRARHIPADVLEKLKALGLVSIAE